MNYTPYLLVCVLICLVLIFKFVYECFLELKLIGYKIDNAMSFKNTVTNTENPKRFRARTYEKREQSNE
jgi:hypothetical protein